MLYFLLSLALLATSVPVGAQLDEADDQVVENGDHDGPLPNGEEIGEADDQNGDHDGEEIGVEVGGSSGGGPPPSMPSCDEKGMVKHCNWYQLEDGSQMEPDNEVTLSIDKATLTLSAECKLEYLGYSYADRYGNKVGTTYVLGFSPYAVTRDLSDVGACENRNREEMQRRNRDEWFGCSKNPVDQNKALGSSEFMSYESSKKWPISMEDGYEGQCGGKVVYRGSFTWEELVNCGSSGIVVNSDDDWLNLSGTLYVSMVSPMKKEANSGFYHVYIVVAAPWVIAVHKCTNVMAATGIRMFLFTCIALVKESSHSIGTKDNGNYHSRDTHWSIVFLTETSSSLFLGDPKLMSSPVVPGREARAWKMDPQPINGPGCETGFRQNICSQMWKMKVTDNECPISFSGEYHVKYHILCSTYITHDSGFDCHTYLEKTMPPMDDDDFHVALSVKVDWKDADCVEKVYEVQYTGIMEFYEDAAYTKLAKSYEVGVDRVYAKLTMDIPDNTLNIFKTTITNVWLCSCAPSDKEYFKVDPDGKGSGCMRAGGGVNVDSPGPFPIVHNGEIEKGYDDISCKMDDVHVKSNEVKWDFVTPNTLTRDYVYCHVQVCLELKDGQKYNYDYNYNRRLLLSDSDSGSNVIQHFMSSLDLVRNGKKISSSSSVVATAIESSLASVMVFAIIAVAVFLCGMYVSYRRFSHRGSGYASVDECTSASSAKYDTNTDSFNNDEEQAQENRLIIA